MDEIEAGKTAFKALVADLLDGVEIVIPTRATQDNFLISLSKNGNRAFLTVSEDDLIDLPDEPQIVDEVQAEIKTALAKLG